MFGIALPRTAGSTGRRLRWMGLAAGVAGFLLSAALAASAARALSPEEAKHLASRTGDIAIPGKVDTLLPLTREQAVDAILAGLRTTPLTGAPAWAEEGSGYTPGMTAEERQARQAERGRQARELRGWWYVEMTATDSPLTERLVYVWHNHFTSAISKVNSPPMMYRQNVLFRTAGTRDLGELVRGIVRDPAMLVYLDNNRNIASAPNENFARELMELYTIGIGNYTERDVAEMARALTGFTVDPATERFVFNTRTHDRGQKTILGRTGAFTGDDVARILLEHPKTAEMLVGKLWRAFVSPTPDPAEVARLSALLMDRNYRLQPVMRDMLLSTAFWDPTNRASLIKSPAEFLVQTTRGLGLPYRETLNLPGRATAMGQDLFNPPNPKGWPGHFAWVNTSALPVRQAFLDTAVDIWAREVAPTLYRTTRRRLPTLDAAGLARVNDMFLPLDPVYVQPSVPVAVDAALEAVLLDATYQTK